MNEAWISLKQRVQVDVPAAEQRIVAAGADHPTQTLGPRLGRVELGREGRSLVAQPLNALSPRRCGRGEGQLGGAFCEPLYLLQFDALPGRIADDRVETADRVEILPVLPYPRKGDFPMQETLAVGHGSGLAPQLGEAGIRRNPARGLRPSGQKLVGIRGLPAEHLD